MNYKQMYPLGCPMRREQLIDEILELNTSINYQYLDKLHENKLEKLLLKIEWELCLKQTL